METCSSPLSTPSRHRIGYARVSSAGQNPDSQIDALKKAGCGRIFSDRMTGSRMERPGWDRLMDYVRAGDTLVVTELSRMTRSLLNLLETAQVLKQRQIHLVSLRENIDTGTATGRCFLSMMGAIHQMERELRAERAAAGRASARARGKTGGRPRTDAAKWPMRKFCMRTPTRSPMRSAGLLVSGGGHSSPTSLSSGTPSWLHDRPAAERLAGSKATPPPNSLRSHSPILPFRGDGQK
jgi:predicted site-specific integrase-resolvase